MLKPHNPHAASSEQWGLNIMVTHFPAGGEGRILAEA